MARIANLTWRHPKLILSAVALLAVLAAAFGSDVEHHLSAAGFTDADSESERASLIVRESLGYDGNPGIVLLVRNPDGSRLDLTDRALRAEVDRLADELAAVEHVGFVDNPLRDRPASRHAAELLDERSLLVVAHLSTPDPEADGGEAAEEAAGLIDSSPLDVSLGGFAASFDEVNDQTRSDLTRAELIAFPALALLLLFVFRGVVAAAIPLLIGVLSIIGTMLVLRVMAGVTDTSAFALNIATGLSLGLAVDYALLIVSRYREEIARRGAGREAHRITVQTAGRTALFSGITVAAALAALIFFPQRFLYSMAVAGAAVGILASVIAILVVPSILALLGDKVDALSIRRGPSVSDRSDGWYRLARGVMRRPVTVALASAGLMLAAAAPFAWTTLTGPSAEAVSPNLPSYPVNEYLEAHYPRDVTEAVTVVVSTEGLEPGSGEPGSPGTAISPGDELAALRQTVLGIDRIERGSAFTAAAGVAYANFALAGPALSGQSQGAVRSIRAIEAPAGSEILVAGNTARFIDQKESLIRHAPLVIVLICAVTMLLLFLLTGSILLPIKTLLMNVLTLGTTLGLMVLAFQVGVLAGPLDYLGPEAIEVTSLVFLFAVIFGLATDYAVLVMARIKERRDLGDSNEEAVATGIARTGRVITAAAMAIALVFLAFSTSSIYFVKQISIGMALGVLLDATVVRALLVPSLMRLFGEWNWWAPRPLQRFHERFGITESEAPPPATEPESADAYLGR